MEIIMHTNQDVVKTKWWNVFGRALGKCDILKKRGVLCLLTNKV
jgi:hypothetical protein